MSDVITGNDGSNLLNKSVLLTVKHPPEVDLKPAKRGFSERFEGRWPLNLPGEERIREGLLKAVEFALANSDTIVNFQAYPDGVPINVSEEIARAPGSKPQSIADGLYLKVAQQEGPIRELRQRQQPGVVGEFLDRFVSHPSNGID